MENKKKISFKDLTVTQSNQLVEATYPRVIQNKNSETELDLKVTTRAHKISRLIISLISPDDEDLRYYKIDISTLKSYLGYKEGFPNGKFYQDLRDISNRLNHQPIELHPEPKRIITAYFISSYELNLKTGEIIFEISGQLKPFLLQLKNNFTSVQLENIPKLSSGYSIRLYELLSQYKNLGKRVFDDIDKLQQMLGSTYTKYSHFKMRILEFAKKDLAQNTNITFDYEEVKTNKKVTSLIFYVKNNKPVLELPSNQLSFTLETIGKPSEDGVSSNDLSDVLKRIGIKSEKITEYLQLGFKIIKDEKKRVVAMERCKDIDTYYNEKLALLRGSKPDMDNPVGFLIKALQEDWITSKSAKEIESQRHLKELREKQEKSRQLEKQYEQVQKQYNQMLKPIYEQLANDPSVFIATYEKVLSEYEQGTLFHKIIMEYDTPQLAYQKSTALNSLMKDSFLKNYPDAFESVKELNDSIGTIREKLIDLRKGKK